MGGSVGLAWQQACQRARSERLGHTLVLRCSVHAEMLEARRATAPSQRKFRGTRRVCLRLAGPALNRRRCQQIWPVRSSLVSTCKSSEGFRRHIQKVNMVDIANTSTNVPCVPCDELFPGRVKSISSTRRKTGYPLFSVTTFPWRQKRHPPPVFGLQC